MRRFLSLVMAAAVTTSLVPTTAFASSDDIRGSVQVIGAWDRKAGKSGFTGKVTEGNLPEVKISLPDVNYRHGDNTVPTARVTLYLENANFSGFDPAKHVQVRDKNGKVLSYGGTQIGGDVAATVYGNALSGSDEVTALEAVLDGDGGYWLVAKEKAGKTLVGKAEGTELTKAELEKISGFDGFVTKAEDAALVDADKFATELGMGEDVVPSANYDWDEDAKEFVKKTVDAEGPESFTIADVAAQSKVVYTDEVDVAQLIASAGWTKMKGDKVLVEVSAGTVKGDTSLPSGNDRVGATDCSVSPSSISG